MKEIKIQEYQVKTQKEAILWHLGTYKSITSWEAIKSYGVTRLSAIIFNLREEGYLIQSVPQKVQNRFGRTLTIAEYKYNEPIKSYSQNNLF